MAVSKGWQRVAAAWLVSVAGVSHAQKAAAPADSAASAPSVGFVGGTLIETQRVQQPPAARNVARANVRPAQIEAGPARSLVVGEVSTIGLPGVARIAIGNGRLVKATVVDENQIVLLAEAEGDTTMHVWLKSGRQVTYTLKVRMARNETLISDLNAYISDLPTLKTRMVGDRILLEGQYPDNGTAVRVKSLAKTFPQVLNLVPDRPLDADPLQLERMVQLDLRVIEVKKRALDQLGVKWANTANGPTVATNVLGYANTPWRPSSTAGFPAVSTGHPAASYVGLATQITSMLSFLERQGDAWTLAEPRLSCKSGGESKFVAGGEIPIPVTQGNGAIGIMYKQYGVLVEFRPVADGGGNIDSGLLIEVSEPDSRNSNMGYIAFTTNRAETQVAIKEGEPFVIAGLLRQRIEKSNDAVPYLGRIPGLGWLFGAKEHTSEQTELFVVVVPRVITPEAAVARQALQHSQELSEGAAAVTGDRLQRAPSLSTINPPGAPMSLPPPPRAAPVTAPEPDASATIPATSPATTPARAP